MKLKNYKSLIGDDKDILYGEIKQIFNLIFIVLLCILLFCGLGIFCVFSFKLAIEYILVFSLVGFVLGLFFALNKQGKSSKKQEK